MSASPRLTFDTKVLSYAAVEDSTRRHQGWDAMFWAVAREAGCRYLLSEDFQQGRTLGGATFVNPFVPSGLPAEIERALGPRP